MAFNLTGSIFKGWNDDGTPAAGAYLYTYSSGTTTPQATYTDATLTTANANPVILNSRGEAKVWLASGLTYSLKLTTSVGVQIGSTVDGVVDDVGVFRNDLTSSASGKGAALIGYSRINAYPANTVGRHANAIKSVLDDGTVKGDGTTADSAAINALIASGGDWLFPAATYLLDATVIIPDYTRLRFAEGSTIKPLSNGLTLFMCKDYGSGNRHAYNSQVWNPTVDANSKSGVVCFDLTGFRHAAGIYFPRFIGAFDHCIKLTKLCWDTVIYQPFAQGCVNGILIAEGSNTCEIYKPGIDGLGSAGYGIKVTGGATLPTTTVTVRSGYVQNFSGAGGVGCWDSGSTTAGTYGTTFERVYFEGNAFADVYFEKSLRARATACEHYTTFGQNGIFSRNSDGVMVVAPLMSSGGRSVGLYNFDTSNINCFGDRTTTAASLNVPLGTVTGIGFLPTEEYGDFPSPGVTVQSSGATNTGTAYSLRVARFHRIGRRVNIQAQVTWSGWSGSAGGVVFSGIPAAFTPTSYTPTGIGTVLAGMPWTGAQLVCYLNGSTGQIAVTQVSAAGALTPLPMTASGSLTIDLTYTI